jgi:hypothetical protein
VFCPAEDDIFALCGTNLMKERKKTERKKEKDRKKEISFIFTDA